MKKRIFAVAACVVILVMSIIPISASGITNNKSPMIPFESIIVTNCNITNKIDPIVTDIVDLVFDFPQGYHGNGSSTIVLQITDQTYTNEFQDQAYPTMYLTPDNLADTYIGYSIEIDPLLLNGLSEIIFKIGDFVITERAYNNDYWNENAFSAIPKGGSVELSAQISAITPSALETTIEDKGTVWNTAALRLETKTITREVTFDQSGSYQNVFFILDNYNFNWNWINVNTGEVVQENNFIFGNNITSVYISDMTITFPTRSQYQQLAFRFWNIDNDNSNRANIRDFYSNNLGEGTFTPWTFGSGNDRTYYLERDDWNVDYGGPFNLGEFLSISIGGIFEPNIFGLFSLGDLMLTVIAIGVIFAVLKYFAGG